MSAVRIHRGARQIGGSCVELEQDGKRLVLDVGLPLDADVDEPPPVPLVPGLAAGDPDLLGVLVSHPHPDHYGLVAAAHPSVPLYIGQAAQRLLVGAAFFTPGGGRFDAAGFLRDRAQFDVGPFRITPYLMDHSAFDSYALLVESGGKRLLYSGDVRAHGRKDALFRRFVSTPPPAVDVLLLEGTHVRAGDTITAPGLSERGVEERCAEVFRLTSGMVLACYSPQNIDRVVSLYKAATRSGRVLVFDLYAASITQATARASIPQAGWEGVRVFLPQSQRSLVIREQAFERTNRIKPFRLYQEQLASEAARLVMTFRPSMAHELDRAGCLAGAQALWSMWPGYLQQASGERLRAWLEQHGVPLSVVHSSGHATVEDLQRLAAAVSASQVVPIHTSAPQRYPDLFANVVMREDGEWWLV